MPDINRLAKSKRFNLNPENISIGCCIYRQIFPMIRSDIQSHMIMVGTQFPEIGCQTDGNIQGISEFLLGIIGGWKSWPERTDSIKNAEK